MTQTSKQSSVENGFKIFPQNQSPDDRRVQWDDCLRDTRSKEYFNKNKRIAALERMCLLQRSEPHNVVKNDVTPQTRVVTGTEMRVYLPRKEANVVVEPAATPFITTPHFTGNDYFFLFRDPLITTHFTGNDYLCLFHNSFITTLHFTGNDYFFLFRDPLHHNSSFYRKRLLFFIP